MSSEAGALADDLEDNLDEDTLDEGAASFASCKFLCFNCDRPVFRREYMRSNRKRKTKILRCFPHCCPAHFPRCYCGCSLHLLVTPKDAAALQGDEIVVCARFEPSMSLQSEWDDCSSSGGGGGGPLRKLARGEEVVLPREVLQPMPQDSVESPWVRAYKESDSRQLNVSDTSVLYVLNNYRFPKWYYGYESGATKSQRERKHHLRVYVLRVGQPCGGGGARLATVLERHASPSFTIASYRRANRSKKSSGISDDGAGSSVRAGGRRRGESSSSDTSSSERDESAAALERELSYPSASRQADLLGSQERDDLQHESHDSAEGILLGLRYSSSHTPDPAPVALDGLSRQPSGGDSRVHRAVDEKLFWRQTRLAPTLARARELAVLQYFVTHAPLDELWGPVLSLENRLWQSWIEPLHRETRDARSRALLQRFCLPAAGAHDPRQHSRDALSLLSAHPALALCAEVAVELVTSRELRDLLRIAIQSANEGEQGAGGEAAGGSAAAIALPTASDHSRKSETRERFAALVDGVHAHVNALVTRSRRRSVGELVDDLVTLVHQSQRLRWLQPAMRELLGAETPDRAAFEAFCAQWREAYMVRHGSPATRTRMVSVEIRSGGGKPPGRWSRRWLLDARSLRVSGQHQQQHGGDPRSSPAYGVSAWELLSTVQQFGAVDVEVDTSASLRVRAALDGAVLLNEDRDGANCSQPMHLRLDGKYRIFRAFPSGVATMAVARGGWVFGDYFGHLESAVSIKVWAFAYQMHMRLQAPSDASTLLPDSSESGGDEADRLVVAVKVDEAKSGPRGGGLEHEPSVRRGDVAPDLRFLSGAERHELWKTLHWRTRSEFEVEYQQVSS